MDNNNYVSFDGKWWNVFVAGECIDGFREEDDAHLFLSHVLRYQNV